MTYQILYSITFLSGLILSDMLNGPSTFLLKKENQLGQEREEENWQE